MDSGIGARIRRARQARRPKMTLARLAGTRLSISLVSKIERGQVWPSLPTLGYLAEQLELPIASLLESDDVPSVSSVSQSGALAGSIARAEAYLALNDPEAALALLDGQAAVSDVQSASVAALRALALLANGRLDEAVAAVQTIEARSPGVVDDWPSSRQGRTRAISDGRDNRGESTASSQKGSGRERELSTAKRLDPARGAAPAQRPVPTGWSSDRDDSEAQKVQRAISASANFATSRFNHDARWSRDRDSDLAKEFRPTLTESDDVLARARAAFVIGEVARQRGRDAAAVDGFRRCLRTPGDDVRLVDLRARALRALAALHDDRGDAETARNLYRQSAALLAPAAHPRQRAASWLRLSDSLERAGDHTGANMAIARAAELAALLDSEAIKVDVDARLGRLAATGQTSGNRFSPHTADGAGNDTVRRRE